MLRHIAYVLAFSFSCVTAATASEYRIEEWFNLHSLNLESTTAPNTKLPVPAISPFLREAAARKKVHTELSDYLRYLSRKLHDKEGLLLRVRVFSNNVSEAELPSGFLVPLSIGQDPIDAYSEYLNLRAVSFTPAPPGYLDVGFYLWVERLNKKTLLIGALPQRREPAFHRYGWVIADRKVRRTEAGRTYWQYEPPEYAQRAGFWVARLEESEARFESETRRQAVEALVRRFDALQEEQSRIIQQARQRKARSSQLGTFIASATRAIAIGKDVLRAWTELQSQLNTETIQRQQRALKTAESQLDRKAKLLTSEIKRIDRELSEIPELKV